jgi:hypothetical protein
MSVENLNLDQNNASGAETQRPKLRKIKRPKHHNGPISQKPLSTATDGLVRPGGRVFQQGQDFSNASNTQDIQSSGDIVPLDLSSLPTSQQNTYPQAQEPQYVTDDEYDDDGAYGNYAGGTAISNSKLMMLLFGAILFGLILGKFFFSSEQMVNNGLQGVVVNPEVPKGRTRCGIAEKTQGCVLYIMNSQRQELNGRDFYDLASQLTGRQRFVIETGNMRYSTIKIKPGNIAQLNIPPLQ